MTQIMNSYANIMDRYNNLIGQGGNTLGKNETAEKDGVNAGISFGDMVTSQMEKMNNSQIQADELIQDFAAGKTEDLHQVMIAAEEARISMELAVQVRNKVVEAYKELSSMQL